MSSTYGDKIKISVFGNLFSALPSPPLTVMSAAVQDESKTAEAARKEAKIFFIFILFSLCLL